MSWSSDWVYGWNDASWLGASIASAEKAKLQAKHMAIGGDGNYHAICTFDDNILLRRRVSKASWKKVTPPPLNGASIVNITIHSTEFDFQQFDIMDGAVSPMALAVVTDDARVLMLAYEADTQLRSSGWKEVMYGPQGVPITDDNRLRARMVSIGNLDQSEGYLTPLVGMLDDDGMPVVLCPRKFSDVKGGEPAPYAKRLWGDVPSRKLACGNSLVVGIDADGSVWGHGVESMPQGACSMHHGGETWFENTFEKSGVEVVDIDAYGRDVAAVTSDGMIHCWTRDYGMLHGIYDAKGKCPYTSFSAAKQFSLPNGHKCVQVAMGGAELVVAISDQGDVFTFGAELGRCSSYPRLGRAEDGNGDEKSGDVAPPTTPTMLSHGKERGHQEGRAVRVSAVKDFFLIGWEAAPAPVQEAAVGPTTPVLRPAAKSSASPPADAPETSGSTRVRADTSLASAAAVGAMVVVATASATISITASYYY